MKRLALAVVLAFTLTLGVGLLPPQQAHASPTAAALASNDGSAALVWAENHAAGCWYSYGGEACSPGFDCSGVVQRAFRAVGISLPRTTYEMLASPHLRRIPVSEAPRGALMFFGSGHVEIKTRGYHATFGAQQSGTRVGWHRWGGSWVPTMAFLVVGG